MLSTIILNCNIFTENSAHGSGGAISSIEESTLVLNGNHFEGNKALFHGGAIFASDSTIDINDGSHIQHINYSSNSLEVTEGMAYFSSNTADIGGACTVTFGGSVVVFSSNSAQSNGGALVSVGSSASFQECFSGSSLIVGARQMYFKGITAQELGGALYQEGGSCFMINNSNSSIEFTANLATSGGAIFSSNSQILAEVGEMIFLNNSAQAFGGALKIVDEFDVNMTISANFIDNTAGICGGAGDVEGKGIIFIDTVATGNSDSAFGVSGDLHYIGTTNFSRNIGEPGEPGGALYVHPESHVSFTGHTVFDGNSADSGGALYVHSESCVSFTGHTVFDGNSADSGARCHLCNGWSKIDF